MHVIGHEIDLQRRISIIKNDHIKDKIITWFIYETNSIFGVFMDSWILRVSCKVSAAWISWTDQKLNLLLIFTFYHKYLKYRNHLEFRKQKQRIQKVLSEGVQLWQRFFFFFFGWWGQDKRGHHRHASETPFKWRFAGVPMMVQHWMLAW